MNKRPGGSYADDGSSEPRRSQLIPILSSSVDLFRKGFLVPIMLAVIVSFMTNWPILWLFALTISGASYYLIYRLCGKPKKSWVIAGAGLFTFLFLHFNGNTVGELNELLVFPISPGIVEEVVKAIPVLLGVAAARLLDPPLRDEIGVFEPLDGILIGTASAVGFALYETMFQYVPRTINTVVGKTGDPGLALFQGLDLIVTRFLGDVTGHIAYSGILGYAIGLAVLKPKNWRQTVLVGYAIAAVAHDIWDGFVGTPLSWVAYVDALLAYAFLASACQKAREMSPNQQRLMQSLVLDQSRVWGSKLIPQVWGSKVTPSSPPRPAPQQQVQARGMGQAAWAGHAAAPYGVPPAAHGGTFLLRVGPDWIPLSYGTRLTERQIPGLESRTADGVVAEVSQNPQDTTVLGLKNLSAGTWTTMDSRNQVRDVPYGKSLRLTIGSRIDFGPAEGEVSK
jgi:RsiW-degrading membrane proteinase PrsW (M82 family)